IRVNGRTVRRSQRNPECTIRLVCTGPRVWHKDVVGRPKRALLQMLAPCQIVEFESMNWRGLLFRRADVVEDVNCDVTVHADRQPAAIGQKQNLARKATA